MKRKKCYETPLIARAQVELEDGVCVTAASEGKPIELDDSKVTIQEQDGFDEIDLTERTTWE